MEKTDSDLIDIIYLYTLGVLGGNPRGQQVARSAVTVLTLRGWNTDTIRRIVEDYTPPYIAEEVKQ